MKLRLKRDVQIEDKTTALNRMFNIQGCEPINNNHKLLGASCSKDFKIRDLLEMFHLLD